jgi:hypothetical protein
MGRNRYEGSEYNPTIIGRRCHVRRHGKGIKCRILVETGKKVYSKSLTNNLHLKQNLYGLKMIEGINRRQHINTFKQDISDLFRSI